MFCIAQLGSPHRMLFLLMPTTSHENRLEMHKIETPEPLSGAFVLQTAQVNGYM